MTELDNPATSWFDGRRGAQVLTEMVGLASFILLLMDVREVALMFAFGPLPAWSLLRMAHSLGLRMTLLILICAPFLGVWLGLHLGYSKRVTWFFCALGVLLMAANAGWTIWTVRSCARPPFVLHLRDGSHVAAGSVVKLDDRAGFAVLPDGGRAFAFVAEESVAGPMGRPCAP